MLTRRSPNRYGEMGRGEPRGAARHALPEEYARNARNESGTSYGGHTDGRMMPFDRRELEELKFL